MSETGVWALKTRWVWWGGGRYVQLELVEAKLHVKSKEWEDLKAETFIHKAKAEEEKIEREQAEANVARLTTELKELGARFASLTAVSADAATNSESLSNKLRVTEQLMNEETREKEMYKAELQASAKKTYAVRQFLRRISKRAQNF
jgi:uncharacterized protein YwgA